MESYEPIWVVTDAGGWEDLGRDGILALELELARNKEWIDIGFPIRFIVSYDGGVTGQIYRLMKNRSLAVV